jgi:hypothetical protein
MSARLGLVMGYSRGQLFRFRALYEKGVKLALQETSRLNPC